MLEVVKHCQDNLTRANIMAQAANLRDLEVPILLPGIRICTSPTGINSIRCAQLGCFKGHSWVLFDDVLAYDEQC